MKAGSHPQNSVTKRIFAGLLTVWLSGIVFLFCCGAMPTTQAVAEAESESCCPLAKMDHHCDKPAVGETTAAENAERFDAFQNGKSAFDCCGFLTHVFDKARKAEIVKQIAAVAEKTVIETPKFAFVKTKSNAFFKYRPRPLNRSGTYLKNRVFRI